MAKELNFTHIFKLRTYSEEERLGFLKGVKNKIKLI